MDARLLRRVVARAHLTMDTLLTAEELVALLPEQADVAGWLRDQKLHPVNVAGVALYRWGDVVSAPQVAAAVAAVPPQHRQWLTAKEAAEHLRFPSVQALYQAVQRGAVKAHRRGGARRGPLIFFAEELDKQMLEPKRGKS